VSTGDRRETLHRDGVRIGYRVSGPEARPGGPLPIVLGHSLLCDGRMWEGVEPALASKRRVLNVDFRGHGTSTAPRPFTLEDLADDWLAILDREKIARALLCGLSMGGMTALRVALRAPERVAAMMLLDSSADAELPSKRLQYRLMVEATKYFGTVRALEPIIARLMFGRTTLRERPELVVRETERMREHDPHQRYWTVLAVFQRRSIHDLLRSIRCPTLVLYGEEDVATPPLRSQRMAAALPSSTLRAIPRAGHLSALEQPQVVVAELEAFLDTLAEARTDDGAGSRAV
jgi:pimeloyl-ACP methyl ester carboxylesterase